MIPSPPSSQPIIELVMQSLQVHGPACCKTLERMLKISVIELKPACDWLEQAGVIELLPTDLYRLKEKQGAQ